MKAQVQSKLDSIFKYPFFDSVGRPLPESVTGVNSWRAAGRECASKKWANCQLMARNALFDAVQRRDWNRGEEWNPLASELRPLIVSFASALIAKANIPENLIQKITEDLSWDYCILIRRSLCRSGASHLFDIHLFDPP